MPGRKCTVCLHPSALDINEALVLHGRSYRHIASQYDLGYKAIERHMAHIPKLLLQASRSEEIAKADTLLDQVEELHGRTEAILDEVEGTDDYRAMLGAIREMRANLTLIGEITKELNRQPQVNLALNPEWVELRTLIIQAVEPFPEARDSILRALEVGGNGAGQG
jgi:hypothetical protein